MGEIELIATRIKRLLVDGEARPGEIAVVFRSPQAVGGLVGEVFGRLGLPVVFESGEALDRSPALRALAALAQLDLDDWPFEQLLTVLGSNYFQPGWPEWREGRAAVYVERTIRRLQIPARTRGVAAATRRERRRFPGPVDRGRCRPPNNLGHRPRLGQRARCFAAAGDVVRMGPGLAAVGRRDGATAGNGGRERKRQRQTGSEFRIPGSGLENRSPAEAESRTLTPPSCPTAAPGTG